MFRPSLRRLAEEPLTKLTIYNNPYSAQKTWPPDFSKLDPKYQFRLERRYRRRAKVKWSRPGWTKGVKLAAWGCSSCLYRLNPSQRFMPLTAVPVVGIYGVLFMDWGQMTGRQEKPFTQVRKWREECMRL